MRRSSVRRRRRLLAALILLAAAAAQARPLPLRGVIEGYYGRPWTGEARRDVIRFLGAHRLNAFVYAPKNDDFHRRRWRDPYPEEALADLAATATAARRAGVRFVIALSPVLDVCYSCDADFEALTAKLAQLGRARVRRFALLFDDGGRIATAEDATRYGGTDAAALARAQADLTNRVRRWLVRRSRSLVFIVPTEYAGTECTSYHAALAGDLRRGIAVGWTGPGVFADVITAAAARARAACLPHHPVVLWDNFPVNDTVVSNNLHLGPLTGREPELPAALGGYLLNPMTQAHASLVALATAATYLGDPGGYAAEAAWAAALDEVGAGSPGFAVLAHQLRSSPLDLDDARELAATVETVAQAYAGAGWPPAVDALEAEEVHQAAAPPDVATRLGADPLGVEVAPWAAELAAHAARGLEAVALLRALKPSVADLVVTDAGGAIRVRGRALSAGGAAATLGPGFAAEAAAVAERIAHPPVTAYLACLGNLVSADIGFCPAFGLNVHGKSFSFLIRTASDITVVTDRNVHDRLVRLAGASYAEWLGRRGPGADTLAVTLDGLPVALATDGSFDASTPGAGGRATLLLTTAAGEATSLVVP